MGDDKIEYYRRLSLIGLVAPDMSAEEQFRVLELEKSRQKEKAKYLREWVRDIHLIMGF